MPGTCTDFQLDDMNLNTFAFLTKFSSLQTSQDRKTNFLKVHAPWDILARYADILNLQRPIKVIFFIKRYVPK